MRQLSFDGFTKPGLSFGGSLLKGNPKRNRPLESKLPIHLTLRATKSGLRTPKNYGIVEEQIFSIAKKNGVRVYKYVNVGNHLHLLVKIPRLRFWAPFIRALTGRIAQLTGTKWLYRPHTRIISGWKRAFVTVQNYLYLIDLEARGFISRKDTKTLRALKEIFDHGKMISHSRARDLMCAHDSNKSICSTIRDFSFNSLHI